MSNWMDYISTANFASAASKAALTEQDFMEVI